MPTLFSVKTKAKMPITNLNLIFVTISPFLFMFLIYFFLPKQMKTTLVDENNRYETIDGLRGIAAVSVMITHSLLAWNYFNVNGTWWSDDGAVMTEMFDSAVSHRIAYSLFSLGGFGVCIFFMITGFLFYDKLLRASGKINVIHFFVKRFFRLSPLYYFVILCVFISVFITGVEEYPSVTKAIKAFLSWLCFGIFDLKTISSIAPGAVLLAGVLWTLAIEWKFYICVPFFSFFTRKKLTAILFVVFGISVVLILFYLHKIKSLDTTLPFFLGMLSSLIINNYIKLNKKVFQNHLTSLIMLIVLFYLIFQLHSALIYKLLAGVFFIVISNGNAIFGILKTKVFMALGTISYGTYLIHGLILFLINAVIMKNGSYVINTLVTIFLTLLISCFTYCFIEKKGINFAANLLRKPKK